MQFAGPRRPSNAKKPADPTQKPVPKNPKYAHVRGKLHTGPTVKNRKAKFDTSGEVFKRVRTSTVFRMLEKRESEEESIFRLGREDGASVMTEQTTASHAQEERKLASLIEDWDLLLLDVRTDEEFKAGHIRGAESFPSLRLRRDQMLPSLYQFKNRRGKVIVLYDDDGYSKLGIDMATDMVRKGFENTLLMSGGVAKFSGFFPHLVVGDVPEAPPPDEGPGAAAAAAHGAAGERRPNTGRSTASTASRRSSGTLGGTKAWK